MKITTVISLTVLFSVNITGAKTDEVMHESPHFKDPTLIYGAKGDEVVDEVINRVKSLFGKADYEPIRELLKKIAYADKEPNKPEEKGIWKITKEHLAQINTENARKKYKSAFQHYLQTDWSKLTLENMKIPLYNGFVATFLIYSQPEYKKFKTNPEQAKLWAEIFKKGDAAAKIKFENELEKYTCKGNTCHYDGICYMDGDKPKCICPVEYAGTNCGRVAGNCDDVACENDGKCVTVPGPDKTYRCECPNNFVGRRCTIKVNLCQPNPCLNGGKCSEVGNVFKCECSDPHTGDLCALKRAENDEVIHDVAKKIVLLDSILEDKKEKFESFLKRIAFAVKGEIGLGIWKLTEQNLQKFAQFSENNITVFSKDMLDKIGSEWSMLTKENMERPFYNGLLASLLILESNENYDDENKHYEVWAKIFRGNDPQAGKKFKTSVEKYRCDTKMCGINGICTMKDDKSSCLCELPYYGDKCDAIASNCENIKCGTNGRCDYYFECQCDFGYTGRYCDIQATQIEDINCQHKGKIEKVGGKLQCVCDPNYEGDYCQTKRHGICTRNDDGRITCKCISGFEGKFCNDRNSQIIDITLIYGARGNEVIHEVVNRIEKESIFESSGKKPMGEFLKKIAFAAELDETDPGKGIWKITANLFEKEFAQAKYSYQEEIKNKFQIDVSQMRFDDMEVPLYNGIVIAVLIDISLKDYDNDGKQTDLWASIYNRIDVDKKQKFEAAIKKYKCTNATCSGNGICSMVGDVATCKCDVPYNDADCSKKATKCETNICENKGVCLADKFKVKPLRCDCFDNFVGRHCTIKMNLCHPNPCQHNKECTQEGNTFKCKCLYPYTGEQCETEERKDPKDKTPIDGKKPKTIECEPDSCNGKGDCKVVHDEIKCTCNSGYEGKFCDKEKTKVPKVETPVHKKLPDTGLNDEDSKENSSSRITLMSILPFVTVVTFVILVSSDLFANL